jgi:hypothetical protein
VLSDSTSDLESELELPFPTLAQSLTVPKPLNKRTAGETIDYVGGTAPHSYTTTNAEDFVVRYPPNYRKNKIKAPSMPALFEVAAVDCFYTKTKIHHVVSELLV